MRTIEQPVAESRLNELAELAEIVADTHCPNAKVVPERIAEAKGITYSFGRYDRAFDGMLEHEDGAFHIFCNLDRVQQPNSGRARFTMCHELGHFFIDEHRHALERGLTPGHGSICDFHSKNPVEIEADHFAAALLMPASRFTRSAKSYIPGMGAIFELADQFGTSTTSTALRYTKLDCGPCIIIKWNPDGYAWRWVAPCMFRGPFRGLRRGLDTVAPDSPTGHCLSGSTQPRGEYLKSGTVASAWFPGAFSGTSNDIIMIEHACRLGEYGVLTVLTPESGSI